MKTFVNWSGGKDCSHALHQYILSGGKKPELLLTTLSKSTNRISMHGVRHELLLRQSEALGIPLRELWLPESPSMDDYAKLMGDTMNDLVSQGYTTALFGDIFLEDLRQYRDQRLSEVGLIGLYPLWQKDTMTLARQFVDDGFKAFVVAADADLLPEEMCGALFDHQFLDNLPIGVDPCGENGEFHTFLFDAPIFQAPLTIQKGEIVKRTYPASKTVNEKNFWFADLS